MTAQVLFDTARFRDRLPTSGMPEPQARAVTEGLDEALRGAIATKADVERQGERISADINRLDAKIEAVEQRLDERIGGVEQRLTDTFDKRLAESQASQLRYIVGTMFGGLGLLFAALKLFP